jgi:hypothetical protein
MSESENVDFELHNFKLFFFSLIDLIAGYLGKVMCNGMVETVIFFSKILNTFSYYK